MSETTKTTVRLVAWNVETDLRPAPIFCAFVSAAAVGIGFKLSWQGYFCGMAVAFGLLSLQITIWRAAQMIVRGGVVIDEQQKKRVEEIESTWK